MQFTLAAAAAAALVATTAASGLAQRNVDIRSPKDKPQPGIAKIVNRCSYPVYLWSIDKQEGCRADTSVMLNTGDFYNERMKDTSGNADDGGISIKLSKFEECGGKDITQLEYKLSYGEVVGNFLDMSFVDCVGNLEDCPGRTDGFYLRSGNKNGVYTSSVNNEHCPIFNIHNAEDATKVSYINWDDRQTKYCEIEADLELYLCGGDAPDADDDDDDDDTPVPAFSAAPSSSQPKSSPSYSSMEQPTPSTPAAPSTTEEAFVVAAAAVTEAPSAPAPVIKTEIVYVTQYVKRHAHGRRHQQFHA